MSAFSNLHIITGAPGSGKTSIIERLGAGMQTVPEPARVVLANLRDAGRDPRDVAWEDFVGLLLEQSLADHARAAAVDEPVVFDRGIPDTAGYAYHLGVDAGPSLAAAAEHRYNPTVLVTRPWREIYTTDGDRTMTFEHTLEFQVHLERAFTETGYHLVEIPRRTVDDRVAIVRDMLQRM